MCCELFEQMYYRSSDSARQGQNNSFKSGSSVPVSTSFNNDYQVLNPHQLYPTHVNQGASRVKLNYSKPSVYKQDNDCRYGVSSLKIYHPLIIISYSTCSKCVILFTAISLFLQFIQLTTSHEYHR